MNKLFKNSLIYTIVTILQKASNFLLLPVFTLYLSQEDYGVFALINSMIMLFSTLFTFQLRAAITRFTVKYKDSEPERLKKIIGGAVYFVLLSSLILTTLSFLIYTPLLSGLFGDVELFPYAALGFVCVLFNPIFQIYQAVLQAKQLGKSFGRNNLFYAFTNILLGLLFVVVFGMKAEGILLALAVTNVIYAMMAYFSLFPMMSHGLFKEELKLSLKYCVPLIPHGVLTWITTMTDRLVITKLIGIANAGLYSISFQAAGVVNLFSMAIHQAYSPWFYQQYDKGDEGLKTVNKVGIGLAALYGVISFVLALLSKEIITLVTSDGFYDAWIAIPFLAFSFAFNGVYFTYCNVLFVEKTKYISWITLVTAVSNLGLNFLLIPMYGILGAGIAALVSKILLALVTIYFIKRINEHRVQFFKILIIPFIFLFAYLPIFYFEYTTDKVGLWFKVGIVLSMAIFCLYFANKHKEVLVGIIKKRGSRNA